jgi:RHS repeat-associated protein
LADVDGFLSVSDLASSATVSSTVENDYIAVELPEGLTFSFTPPSQGSIEVPAGAKGIFAGVSPQGRMSFNWVNGKGRVIKDTIPGIEATCYSYDLQGRLAMVSQGGRTAVCAYNSKGFLATATDPVSRISRFEYDSVGRITRQVLPDLHEILYSYDVNGKLTGLTPPEKYAHSFDYSKVDLIEKYTPPILGGDTLATRYEYDKDKQIVKVLRPDGVVVTIYDSIGCSACGNPVGRPKQILFDRGSLDFKYDPFTGLLDTLIAPIDTTLYAYDGSLLTSITKPGKRMQHLNYYYDDNFRVTDQELWVTNPDAADYDITTDYTYDKDGLITAINLYDQYCNPVASTMGIERDPATGRVTNTSLGNISTSQNYDSIGALSYFEADFGGSSIFQTSYKRDSLGRITALTEVNQGQTILKEYVYDIAGRLWKVWRNDTLISTYLYDANGNRIVRVTPSSADSGSYDAQDRMLSYGNVKYVYGLNGELQGKICGTDTTSYSYDHFGNLITVILPNKDRIDYLIDGQNRRIGKEINGQLMKQWIYSSQLSPVAELDGTGNVIAQFVGNLMIKNGTSYELITDNLGSVKLVVDVHTGSIVQQIDYDEFGNVVYDSNPDFQPFGYAGGLHDSETKLTRFGARDYDASSGRWTCKDPKGFGGCCSNFYEYAFNDPVNNVDPDGRQIILPILGNLLFRNTVNVSSQSTTLLARLIFAEAAGQYEEDNVMAGRLGSSE